MTATVSGFVLQYQIIGNKGTVQLTANLDGRPMHSDKLDIARASARERFGKALLGRCPELDAGDVDAELLRIVGEIMPSITPPVAEVAEIEITQIVRPELFYSPEVSGITVPVIGMDNGEPVGQWQLYLQWADGDRERQQLTRQLQLQDGSRLWIDPVPAAPSLTQPSGWSAASRQAWLNGDDSPAPHRVFQQLSRVFAHYLDFPPEVAAGTTAVLSLWTVLTYAYPCWPAVPYLNIGGPLGSGKSRVFELLARLVFRAMPSANMTAPTLFRSLHESGGVLLLDEAERLRDQTPDAGEIRSVLLSGYKKGSPARRLEPAGDGKFITRSFQVYGVNGG